MGLSINGSQGTHPLLAELSSSEAQENQADELDGLSQSGDQIDSELQQQGILRGPTQAFVFVKQSISELPKNLMSSCLDKNSPSFKQMDSQGASRFLESPLKEKTIKMVEACPQKVEKKEEGSSGQKANTPEISNSKQIDPIAQRILKESLPSCFTQSPKYPNQSKHTSPWIVQRPSTETKRQENRTQKENDSKKLSEEENRPTDSSISLRREEKKSEYEEKESQKKEEKDQEGFSGGGQGQSQEENEEEKDSEKIERAEPIFVQQIKQYGAEESILSQVLGLRVSQFDVLILFIEILKLEIKNRELHKLARRDEREFQIKHMQKVVENYKSQANTQLWASITSGVAGLVSGALPIAGHLKGDWIKEKLGGFGPFAKFRTMDTKDCFKSLQRMTQSISEFEKSRGEINTRFAEGDRTFDQHMSDLYRSDWEESTRTIDDIKENWKSIENFLYQNLQMYHDVINTLYRH